MASHSSCQNAAEGNQTAQTQNPLDQDLAELRRTVSDPEMGPVAKEKARKTAALIEWFVKEGDDWLSEEADRLGVKSWCISLSNEQLAGFVADSLSNPEPILYTAGYAVLKKEFMDGGCLPGWRFHFLVQWLFDVLAVALVSELGRRQAQNENKDGCTLRAALISLEEDPSGAQLEELSRRTCGPLWLPGDRTAGRQDAAAEIAVKIWEDISEFTTVTPMAANSKVLMAFTTGKFNRVLGRARDHVRAMIETMDLRTKKGCPLPDEIGDSHTDGGAERAPNSNSTFSGSEWRILIEQLISHAELSEKEERVLRNRYFEGKSQKEIAQFLKVSQGEVSKTQQAAQDKLKQAASLRGDSHTSSKP